jgi:hypothetical protein
MPKLSKLEDTEGKDVMFEIYGLQGNVIFYLTTDMLLDIPSSKYKKHKRNS